MKTQTTNLIDMIITKLDMLKEEELLNLATSLPKEALNSELNGFPAGDIALRVKSMNYTLTTKQRQGIQNVIAHYYNNRVFYYNGRIVKTDKIVEKDINKHKKYFYI